MQKFNLFIAGILGFLAVALGASGSHLLREHVNIHLMHAWETAVQYQFYHVFALISCSILYARKPSKLMRWAYRFFVTGIVLFSGSLYLLSTSELSGINPKILGPITPIGGICFLVGWVLFSIYALTRGFGLKRVMGI